MPYLKLESPLKFCGDFDFKSKTYMYMFICSCVCVCVCQRTHVGECMCARTHYMINKVNSWSY